MQSRLAGTFEVSLQIRQMRPWDKDPIVPHAFLPFFSIFFLFFYLASVLLFFRPFLLCLPLICLQTALWKLNPIFLSLLDYPLRRESQQEWSP